MTAQARYQVAQGLEVLNPKSGPAYPIPCDEWSLLKGKIAKLTSEPWFFDRFGSLLWGATLSTFIAIQLRTFSLPEQLRQLLVAWSVVVIGLVCGSLCLVFARMQRRAHRERAADVVSQMDLIEKRYESASP